MAEVAAKEVAPRFKKKFKDTARLVRREHYICQNHTTPDPHTGMQPCGRIKINPAHQVGR
jgi:hypothetical protein